MPMADFGVTTDPARVGFDAERLARIDRHFAKYVDDGRLPGWQIAISRHGEMAHLSSYGQADIEAGRAVEADTIWRIYSMSKAGDLGRGDDALRRGRVRADRPDQRWIPEFANPQVYVGGQAAKADHGPGDRADPGVAPAHPHRRSHLRLPPRPRHRRDLSQRRPRVGAAQGRGPRRRSRRVGRDAACIQPRQRVAVLGRHRRRSDDSSRSGRASHSMHSSPSGSSPRWTCATAASSCPRPTTTGSPRSTPSTPNSPEKVRYDAFGEAFKQPAAMARRWRRPGVDQPRLHALLADAAARRRARWRAAAVAAHRALHEPEPPAGWRRSRDVRPTAVRRDEVRRRRLRPGFAVTESPVGAQGADAARASPTGAAWRARRSGWIPPRTWS